MRYSIEGQILTDIADAINAKTGGTTALAPQDMADEIDSISGGGTSAPSKDVNFIDYDGTIVYSYTAAEFAELTAMPANPSHDGLTAQGWNWSLSDAQDYVAKYGFLTIGQMYITSDGKTRIYIRLEEGRLEPYLSIAVNGTAIVDWGDGTATSTVMGSSTTTAIDTQHIYATAGDYVIAISVNGEIAINGSASLGGSILLWKNVSIGNQSLGYRNTIKKIEIGSHVNIGTHAFYACSSLASITIPDGITSIKNYTFYACYALASITIPDSVTSIGTYAFQYCGSFASIAIPNGVTSIGTYAFQSCYTLASITIPDSVISIGNYTFQTCYALASITIPDSVTSIGSNAFASCYSLSSAIIPDSVTSIGSSAFQNCYPLSNVVIPDGVTTIVRGAFQDCYGLGFIKFINTTPPTVTASSAWSNIPTDCKIYVPAGSLTAYTSATNYPGSSTYTYVEY